MALMAAFSSISGAVFHGRSDFGQARQRLDSETGGEGMLGGEDELAEFARVAGTGVKKRHVY